VYALSFSKTILVGIIVQSVKTAMAYACPLCKKMIILRHALTSGHTQYILSIKSVLLRHLGKQGPDVDR
jgi:predicted RNA-binding Zn-ribbon protein involved in translation (DUF1610 family)